MCLEDECENVKKTSSQPLEIEADQLSVSSLVTEKLTSPVARPDLHEAECSPSQKPTAKGHQY
jgi:hypothetical protein